MAALDVSGAIPIDSADELDARLRVLGDDDRELIVSIFKQASRRQTVTLSALQEVALCHGWVDTQTKRIDAERYAIKFVRRRPGSNWSPKNREMARNVLAAGRMAEAGRRTLPPDL